MKCVLHGIDGCTDSDCSNWIEDSGYTAEHFRDYDYGLPRPLYGRSFFARDEFPSPHAVRVAMITIKAPERLTELLMKLEEVRKSATDAPVKEAIVQVQRAMVSKIEEILLGDTVKPSVNTRPDKMVICSCITAKHDCSICKGAGVVKNPNAYPGKWPVPGQV